jgi:lipoprotein-anchoring transpeptidase ErfK/SrfK
MPRAFNLRLAAAGIALFAAAAAFAQPAPHSPAPDIPAPGQPAVAAEPAPPPMPIDSAAINNAQYRGGDLPEGQSALTLRIQIMLDRAGVSPGVIDGYPGDNVSKAIAAYEELNGLPADGAVDLTVLTRLAADRRPVLIGYRITEADVAGPFVPDIPTDYAAMAQLDRLGYRGPQEELAERFHMDEDLLRQLNPDADFGRPGTEIVVADVASEKVTTPVARLVADKEASQLRGYDTSGALVVAYPATIGSAENPSPSGTHIIEEIVPDAAYYYRPDVNFQQGDNTEPLTIPPGPNNPIGSVWIDLSEPTYGIHGTPEPSKIDKTRSHGCVRLTNWDVEELAGLVKKGVPVEFR